MRFLQKIEVAVALTLLSCCGATACMPNAKHPVRDRVDCYAAALEPVVGEVYDANQLARDVLAGKASLGPVLRSLNVDEAAAGVLLEQLRACKPAPVVAPDAGVVTS